VGQSYSPNHPKSTPDKSEDTSKNEDTEIETEDETEEDESEETESESEGSETDDEDENEEDDSEPDDGEKESSDEGEEDSEQYLDLKNVPAPLKSAAKKMLASHTKAMQKLQKQFEGKVTTLEQDMQDKYSEAIVKSAGWDKLTKIPEFVKWWEAYSSGTLESRPNRKNDSEEDESFAEDKKEGGISEAKIAKIVNQAVAAAIAPYRNKEANDAWSDAEKNLPNFKKYKADVTSYLSRHPTLSIKEAYDFVSAKDREKEAVQKAMDEVKKTTKKIPKTLKSGSSGGKKDLDRSTIKSLDDAIAAARRGLGG